ncbi:hypothetical protein C8F04DRAFT_163455 [Mycena alexandri]|uniref:Uncharacterized protein n=1 Tax=Mycena alexandri TaxID=1745969 RepID=A0AAD6SAI1_9AGAR|nr:hypothetical protein C8F04DRAFT_163455 [Mycena alexandri]
MHVRPPSLFSDNVRHLYLSPTCGWSYQTASALVRLCPHLVCLFFEADWPQAALLPVLEGISHVRIWRGSLRGLFGDAPIDLGHPFFRTITHIDVTLHRLPLRSIVPSLRNLPVLTHLCLHNNVAVDNASNILEQCPRLRILFILCHLLYAEVADAISSEITDMRCVVVVRGDPIHDWSGWVAHGGNDFWAGAEAFVARKRRGEIPVSARWVEPWW